MANWLSKNAEFRRMPLNEALRVKRCVDGYSQQALAEKLGMYGKGAISKIETGRIIAPRSHMKVICDYLYGEEKGSVGKKESKVEEYSIGFSPLDGKQDLPHVLDLSTENIEMVVGCLKLKVLHTTDDYLLYEPFMVTIVRHNCPSPKCVAMGRIQDFYRVLFTPNGIELKEKKGA